MKKMITRRTFLKAAGISAASLGLAACGGSSSTSTSAAASTAASAAASSAPADTTLSVWGQASVWLPSDINDPNKVPFLLELQENTGVTLDLTAASGSTQEQFNLMIAGGRDNLPDIIDNVNFFEGGAASAYDKGYIIELNDLIDQYAPNFKKYMSEHPAIDKMVKTDEGKYLSFPMVRGSDELCCFNGLVVRKDWLDEAGLPVPKSMDDWYKTLTVFRDKFGATAPFVMDAKNRWHYNNFAQAYGTAYDYFLDDNGNVTFGPIQPGFKDFLAEMNRWYKEGLLDPNYLTSDSKARDAAITTGQAGALWGAVGGGVGKYMQAVCPENPKYELVGAPSPTLTGTGTPMLGYKADNAGITGMSISCNCKNVELAVKFLDYGYGEEGNMLYNFGTEGVSYEMVNGEPVFTDLVTNNPDGLTISQAMSLYIGASHMNGGFVQDLRYYNQYLALPQQREAVATWAATDAAKHLIPPVSLTAEESSECGSIETDIWTLVDENVAAFIAGERSLNDFDKFVQEVKSMNVDRAIEIKQAAVKRYQAK